MMLWNGFRHTGPKSGGGGKLADRSRQAVEIQRIAGQRADEIGAAAFERRVQRGRMRDLALLEFRIVVGDVDIEAAAGDETALVERIFVGGV